MEVGRRSEDSLLHLDTVRALHQTVVSLRKALESSKEELKELKDKYESYEKCDQHINTIEKLSLENHILRRRILSSESIDKHSSNENLDETDENSINVIKNKEKIPKILITVHDSDSHQELNQQNSLESSSERESPPTVIELGDNTKFKKTIELKSNVDVKISVSTGENTEILHDNFNNPIIINTDKRHINYKSSSIECITMAMKEDENNKSTNEGLNFQVKITSDDNVTVDHGKGQLKARSIEVDDLSYRSEDDNSVFTEGAKSPEESQADVGGDGGETIPFEHESESDEVDDIELIFTTEETKDVNNFNEDLVSISDTDWKPSSSSTPVLIKFNTLDCDFQPDINRSMVEKLDDADNENQCLISENTLKIKRISLPDDKEIKKVLIASETKDLQGILKSENLLRRKKEFKCMDSSESFDNRTSLKSSSFDIGSSGDTLQRDESVDSFQCHRRYGHRFSLYPETDLTKCGISEEDVTNNVNLYRRYTSPNPLFRDPVQKLGIPRIGAPRLNFAKDGTPPARGMSARWTSDGSLSRKLGHVSHLTTLPNKISPPTLSRKVSLKLDKPEARQHHNNENRRLLSDIGFTSMVPELSRSAEPVWAETGQYVSQIPRCPLESQYRTPCCALDALAPCSGARTPCNNCGSLAHSSGSSLREYCGSLPELYASYPREQTKRQAYKHVSCDACDGEHTPRLLKEANVFVRRSMDDVYSQKIFGDQVYGYSRVRPYIPSDAKQLKLGHIVKVIAPHGQIVVGRVRYIGDVVGKQGVHIGVISNNIVGCERAQLLCRSQNALLVPFHKLVMAWDS